MLIVFELAGFTDTHPDILEVSCTLIASPFARVVVVYVEAVSPPIGVAPLYH
jgi:hypothetical protein